MRPLTLLLLAAIPLSSAHAQRAPLFARPHGMLPQSRAATTAVVLGDLDGDGDLDALLGNRWDPHRTAGGDQLFLNDGTGVFRSAAGRMPAAGGATACLALGDLDGDGDLDAFAGRYGQDVLLLNDGSASFALSSSGLPVSTDSTKSVALGDVDGDGDLDAFLGGWGVPAQNRLYLNDGAGTFRDATVQIPVDDDQTNAVLLGDVDGDGDLDAFTGSDQRITLYLNDGAGTFRDATAQLPLLPHMCYSAAFGDVDGDGDLDVYCGMFHQNQLLLNDGSGRFSNVTSRLPIDQLETVALAIGDLDGDGDLDIWNGGFPGRNQIYLNDGRGNFTSSGNDPPAINDNLTSIALGDVDGDGDLDALEGCDWNGSGWGGQSRLFLNRGAALFSEVSGSLATTGTRCVALGDVDGDGDLDVLLGKQGQNEMLLHRGSGSFTTATNRLPPDSERTEGLALGDVDSDGDLDILWIGGRRRLYLNDGSGTFRDASHRIPWAWGSDAALALGDLDGDGDLDAVLGTAGAFSQDELLLNDGSGTFASATSRLPAGRGGRTQALALGDVDGDGDLDILLGMRAENWLSPAHENRLFLNDGTGAFRDAGSQIPREADATWDVDLFDADGDGDLDAFISNDPLLGNPPSRLWLNDGTGRFLLAATSPAGELAVRSAACGDVDSDGDLDLLLGAGSEHPLSSMQYRFQQNRLLLNDGSALFADATTRLPTLIDQTLALALADVDLDGDLDAFIVNNHLDHLDVNLTRQLTWHGRPRQGIPFTLDLDGPPGNAWQLAFAPAETNLALPPFGRLRLDPLGLSPAGTGLLDSRGHGTFHIPLPPGPALVGTTLYWQAALAFPLALTNQEITVIEP